VPGVSRAYELRKALSLSSFLKLTKPGRGRTLGVCSLLLLIIRKHSILLDLPCETNEATTTQQERISHGKTGNDVAAASTILRPRTNRNAAVALQ
jgi:hypothetical protein